MTILSILLQVRRRWAVRASALREQQEQSTTGTQRQPEEHAESYRRSSASSSSIPRAERDQRHIRPDFALREQQEQSTTGTQRQPEEHAELYRRPSASSSSIPRAECDQRHNRPDIALREQQEQSTTGTQRQPEEQAESYQRPSASSSSIPRAERDQRHNRPGLVIWRPPNTSRSRSMSYEKTVKELIYELGYHAAVLQIITLNDLNEHRFRDIQEHYDSFKTRALKFGVELPDLTEDALNLKFLHDQTANVEEYVNLHTTLAMSQLYQCGCAALLFLWKLNSGKKTGMTPTGAPSHLQDLIISVKVLGVDLGNQLEVELKDICDNYMNLKFDQDVDSIGIKLKKKVCGLESEIYNPSPQLGHKRSEVDPTRVITDEYWTVSLVRLPDRSNSEHAFIVLEGKTGRMSNIWFADFVAVHWVDTIKPGTEEGKVRMEYYESDQTSNRLLFQCQKRMMDVRGSDRLLFSTWQIAKSGAQKLIQIIKVQREKPPKYHILGDNSVLAGSSARSSSNPIGHNCFTFAKMLLRDLNDPFIKLPENDFRTWIGSATSRYLVDKQLRSREWYKTTPFLLMFGFLASIVVAFLYKTF